MSTSPVAPSDTILSALALQYRLIGLDALKKGTKLDELVQKGVLDQAKVEFLRRKARRGAGEAPIKADDFLAMAEKVGHLRNVTAKKFAGTLRATGYERDYEAACALLNHGILALYQVIDTLEELDRPLQYSVSAKVAYFPADLKVVDPEATCPTTGEPLVMLTNLPTRGLESPGLPDIDRLVMVRLDPRLQNKKAGQLVLQLASRYRLITPEQAELASDGATQKVQEAVQYLFEEGFLTTSSFKFLLNRAEEVLREGKGIVGTAKTGTVDDLALSLGYLTREALDAFREEWQIGASADVPAEHVDLGVIQLMFNRGFIEQYQAIDLLEKRGIVLDHSAVGGFQVIAKGDTPGTCPVSGTPLVRLVGWKTAAELARPLPAIERLVVHELQAPVVAEAAETANEASLLEGSRIFSLTTVASGGIPIDEDLLVQMIERYHIVAAEGMVEAKKLAKQMSRPLFDVLREFGYLSKLGSAFVRRRLGVIPNDYPTDVGLLELASYWGYIGSIKQAKSRDTFDELKLLAKAFNKGQFEFYQFMDVVETKALWLDHSPKAQVQLFFATGERDPSKPLPPNEELGELVALSKPGPRPKGVLPLPTRLEIVRGKAGAQAADDKDDDIDVSGEPLPAQLVLRYHLMPGRELASALRGWHRAGEDPALPQYLFKSGKLTAQALNFLLGKQKQFAGGKVQVGEMQDARLTAIATTKNYVTDLRLAKMFGQPGAPDQATGDDLQIGCFLLAKGALTFYQLIDLCEEKGYVLLTTADHKRQFHVVGDYDPTGDYGDPQTKQLLLPLTSPPGSKPRLERLPELKGLKLERKDAADLPVLRAGKKPKVASAPKPAAPKTEKRTAGEILDATSLDGSMLGATNAVEVVLSGAAATAAAAPSPAAQAKTAMQKKATLEKREVAARHTAEDARKAMQEFYNQQFPQRELTTRIAAPSTGRRGVADLVTVRGPSAEALTPRVKSDPAAERLVSQGIHRMMRGIAILGGFIGVGLVVGLGMAHQDAARRRAAGTSLDDRVANPATEPATPTLEAKAREKQAIVAFGQIDPRSVNLDDKSFFLTVDLGQQVLVRCTGDAASEAFAPLARMAQQAQQGGDPVFVRVEGMAGCQADGKTYFLGAVDLAKHNGSLPVERLR